MQITIREPGSAITHFIGCMMALFASVPLLIKAGVSAGGRTFTAMLILCSAWFYYMAQVPLIIP